MEDARMMRRSAVGDADNISQTLILGDATIRDISERGLNSATVRVLSAARLRDVAEEVSADQISVRGYRNILLHVGTSSCTSCEELQRAGRDYRRLLKRLIGKSSPGAALVVSTVCPRTDSPEHQGRVDSLNASIKEIARDLGCRVVDNDNNFRMKDDSVDPTLLDKGGLYFTQAGTLRLLRNFQVALPELIRSPDRAAPVKRLHHQLRRAPAPGRRARENHRSSSSNNGAGRAAGRSAETEFRQAPSSRRSSGPDSCKYCGERNHLASRCKFEEPLICHNCFGLGHKSWMCTVKRRKCLSRREWKR